LGKRYDIGNFFADMIIVIFNFIHDIIIIRNPLMTTMMTLWYLSELCHTRMLVCTT